MAGPLRDAKKNVKGDVNHFSSEQSKTRGGVEQLDRQAFQDMPASHQDQGLASARREFWDWVCSQQIGQE